MGTINTKAEQHGDLILLIIQSSNRVQKFFLFRQLKGYNGKVTNK